MSAHTYTRVYSHRTRYGAGRLVTSTVGVFQKPVTCGNTDRSAVSATGVSRANATSGSTSTSTRAATAEFAASPRGDYAQPRGRAP
ncbi:Uncharacterised protein [Mycobacteroides abscessus subsp. abscessus]|nr:Uncharacterised protein [Mycobacteroides abscessus subsp. abscessus]